MSLASIVSNNLPICLQRFQVSYTGDLGVVKYSNVCLYPTFTPGSRSWNFVQQVELTPTQQNFYTFTYDFTNVIFPPEYIISFTGPVQGVMTIGNSVTSINVQKYMSYTYNFFDRTIEFTLQLPCVLKRTAFCMLNLFINDGSSEGFELTQLYTLVSSPCSFSYASSENLVTNNTSDLITLSSTVSGNTYNINVSCTIKARADSNPSFNIVIYQNGSDPNNNSSKCQSGLCKTTFSNVPQLTFNFSYTNAIADSVGFYFVVNSSATVSGNAGCSYTNNKTLSAQCSGYMDKVNYFLLTRREPTSTFILAELVQIILMSSPSVKTLIHVTENSN